MNSFKVSLASHLLISYLSRELGRKLCWEFAHKSVFVRTSVRFFRVVVPTVMATLMATLMAALIMAMAVSDLAAQSSHRFAESDVTPDDGLNPRRTVWPTELLYDANEPSNEELSGLPLAARREVIRRQQNINESRNAVNRGDVARYDEGDLETAVAEYRKALDLLPDAPMTKEVRSDIAKKYADASVELAESRVAEGRYSEAISLLEAVLAPEVMPEHKAARSLLEKLKDPQWFNPSLSPEHTARVELVEEALEKAMGFYALGDLDSAQKEYERVLNIDRYNSGARRGMEVVDQEAIKYYESAYDETRARFLREVMAGWETQIPEIGIEGGAGGAANNLGIRDGVAINNAKLKSIIIPRIEFTDTPLEDAIEFLRQKSVELDVTEPDPSRKGVNIIIQDSAPPAAAAAPAVNEFGIATGATGAPAASGGGGGPSPRVTLTLANIPLVEALRYTTEQAQRKVKVEAFAVKIVLLTDVGDELFTKTYRVPPSLLNLGGGGGGGGGGAVDDPFAPAAATGGGSSELVAKPTAKEVLEDKGITFPPGSSAFYNPGTSQLVVRNTQSNMELVDSFVDSIQEEVQKQLTITTKFIEIEQDNREELAVGGLLGNMYAHGPFPSPAVIGSDVALGGGTTGNVQRGGVTAGTTTSDFPVEAGTPVTGGLRSGSVAIAPNGIDQVIANSFSGNVSGSVGGTPAQLAPAIFGIVGFGDPSFAVVLRGLSQKKGVDLVTAPSVTARSGQRAKVEVVREFIYPTEYDPPDIPNNIGSRGGGQSTGSFPVTPANPTAVETRSVGVTLEVDPVIGADGYTVDLNLVPEVVEFDWFLNYGSPITANSPGSVGFPGDLVQAIATGALSLIAPGTVDPTTQVLLQETLPPLASSTLVLSENRIVMPVFSSRRATTAVTVWDGQTVIIGGLIREDTQKIRDKIPIFGDLPVVGNLFRSRADVSLKRNLSILVTPKLIDPAGQPIRNFDAIADTKTEAGQ